MIGWLYLQGYGAFVIGYGSGGFGGLLLISYTWLDLDGGAAFTAPDWLPMRDVFFPGIYLVLDFSSSGKQQGRLGLPNCGFAACDGVSLAMADSVLPQHLHAWYPQRP